MSLQMHETLKKYIIRERRRKKEEDEASEQKIREEMKKVEMNTQTLEQTKNQLKQLETKLDDLQLKRRELFNQLKKVLHEETTLKKNNRPPIALTPQGQMNPMQLGSPSLLNYQQLITSQMQQHDQPSLFGASSNSGLNGPPQLINQPTLPVPSATPPNSNNNSNLPISSPSLSSSNGPGSNNSQLGSVHLNSPKPQSPFHPPQLMPHLGPNFPLIPPGGLKYGIPTPISPQILNAHQHASPSSSPRHQLPSASSNPSSQTSNGKRARSPSPQTSISPANSVLSQFVFNQNQLTPSRSPATHSAQSPPPSRLEGPMFSNSPSSSKKTRGNNLIPSNSPSLLDRERQSRQNSSAGFNPTSGMTPQQQSAFSAYHHSLINSRPGPLNTFQPPQGPQSGSQQSPHSKLNKSPNVQSPFNQGLLSPGQQSSSQNPYMRGSGNNLQPPSFPPPSHSPLNFNSMTNHYLKQLAQETTQKMFQQQAQQHHQQQSLQQHLLHQQQIQMLSAAAAAAAAAAHNEMNNNNNPRLSNSTGPSTASGGGSIMTGFSRSASNPSQQRPPSNY